jgi:phage terminase large subunit-like protein
MEWTTACPDWERRLVERRSIIPPPIYADQAQAALAIFKQLQVVDLPKTVWDPTIGEGGEHRSPNFGECGEQWVFDFVAVIFGAYDARDRQAADPGIRAADQQEEHEVHHRRRHHADGGDSVLAKRRGALDPGADQGGRRQQLQAGSRMVRADEELAALFHIQDHIRTITHRVTRASLKVVAADTDTVSGKKSGKRPGG